MKKIILALSICVSASAYATDPEWSPTTGHANKKAATNEHSQPGDLDYPKGMAGLNTHTRARTEKALIEDLRKTNEGNIEVLKAIKVKVPASLKCLSENIDQFVLSASRGEDLSNKDTDQGLSPAQIRLVLTSISDGIRQSQTK